MSESVTFLQNEWTGPNQWEKARKAIEILSKIPVCVAGESSRAGESDWVQTFLMAMVTTIEFLDLSCWSSKLSPLAANRRVSRLDHNYP